MAEGKDKLVYFNIRARAEAIRMLYVVAGKDFEDYRLKDGEFDEIKKGTPLGQVPTMTTSEGELCQSSVIARYVAKKHGLAGTSLWEETLHDLVVESTQECMNAYAGPNIYKWKVFKMIPTPENSEQVLQAARDKWVRVLNYVQTLAENRCKKYIVGDELGLAEVWLYAAMDFCRAGTEDIMSLTPWAKKFVETVEADPRLAKYLAERPHSNL